VTNFSFIFVNFKVIINPFVINYSLDFIINLLATNLFITIPRLTYFNRFINQLLNYLLVFIILINYFNYHPYLVLFLVDLIDFV